MKPTFITLLALCLCLGGCGKKEPVQPATTVSDKDRKAAEKMGMWFEPTKAKATAGVKLWEFETGGAIECPPPPSVLMARFT